MNKSDTAFPVTSTPRNAVSHAVHIYQSRLIFPYTFTLVSSVGQSIVAFGLAFFRMPYPFIRDVCYAGNFGSKRPKQERGNSHIGSDVIANAFEVL